MENRRIVVIGGSAAGAKAAAKARRLDQNAEITIIQKEPDLSMATCGYPYYIGGTFDTRSSLLATPTGVVRDPGFFLKTKNIKALINSECLSIDRENRSVHCRNLTEDQNFSQEYDKLILATGGLATKLPVAGNDLSGISHLKSMGDCDYLHDFASSGNIKQAVVIGGGLIGVEACEALRQKGIEVTLLEMEDQILTMLDAQFARLVQNHMQQNGVTVLTSTRLENFIGDNGILSGVMLMDGTELPCQLAITATGITPASQLAADAGLAIGETGGIVVNEYMQTSDESIYAAGDCVECVNIITGKKVFTPLGDLANLQGRVAGENVITNNTKNFPGTIQTSICKIFDFTAGSTGLSEKQAQNNGITDIETVINASPDKPGFMGPGMLVSKLVVERKSERILGFQCVGNGDVSRQLSTMAMAVKAGMNVTDITCADQPYAPPYSLAIDHCIASSHIMQNKLAGRFKAISAKEVQERHLAETLPFMLDVRSPDEFEKLRLDIGEHLVPLGALRGKLENLPEDKSEEIVCYCMISLRGYEAALILEAYGFTNIKVMEGGIMAWPYTKKMQ